MRSIAALLPEADVVSEHETTVALPPPQALELVLETPVAPDAVVRALLRLRGLSTSGTLAHIFPVLESSPTEIVFGFAGRPWRPSGDRVGFHEARPGTVRIAAGFRAEPTARGSRLVTETRVAAVDEAARRAFLRYWRVVGPFSGLVRRRWLAAVRRRAEAIG